jgi:hypothetical protein
MGRPKDRLGRRVKAVLTEMGQASPRQVAARLGLPEEKVRRAMRDLVAGDQAREGQVFYRPKTQGEARADLQENLWRACLEEKQGFTLKEVTVLSGASRDYAKKTLRFWDQAGWLERVGRRGNLMVYRVPPGKGTEPPPHFHRRAERRRDRAALAADLTGLRAAWQGFMEMPPAFLRSGPVQEVLAEMRADLEGLEG